MGLLYDNYQTTYNPTTTNNNKLNINAISGTLVKTYKDSFIVRFEKGSAMEHFYLDDIRPRKIIKECTYTETEYDEEYEVYCSMYYILKDIVVLQVMLMSDNNYLVEAIDKDKFDKMFELESGIANLDGGKE